MSRLEELDQEVSQHQARLEELARERSELLAADEVSAAADAALEGIPMATVKETIPGPTTPTGAGLPTPPENVDWDRSRTVPMSVPEEPASEGNADAFVQGVRQARERTSGPQVVDFRK